MNEFPISGGSYRRDPVTGDLVRIEEPSAPPQTPAGTPIPVPVPFAVEPVDVSEPIDPFEE